MLEGKRGRWEAWGSRRQLWLSSAFAVLVACALVGRLHAFFWSHAGQYGGDDGYTMALGERLVEGSWLPYVDGCSHRGPLLYWVAALAQVLTGRFGWLGARVLSIATTYGTLIGVFGVGVAARKPLAGAIGALFFAWSVLALLAPSPAYAITGEGLASPLAVLSLLFTTLGLWRASHWKGRLTCLALAGATAALAGLAKQTALPIIAPLAIWVFVHATQRLANPSSRRAFLLALFGGYLGVLLVVVIRYAMAGKLHALWYWYYSYNAHVYMAPYRGASLANGLNGLVHQAPWSVGIFGLFAGWGAIGPLVAVRGMRPSLGGIAGRYASAGLESTAAWMALGLFASAVAPMRFWPHYFLPVFPFVGLLIGFRCEAALFWRRRGAFSQGAALVLLASSGAVLALAIDGRLTQFRAEARHGGWPNETREPICDVIDASSGRNDSLFAWGFSGDLYLTCRRRPASRYVYLTLVAGTVPPAWSDVRRDRVAENARENLVLDLRRERPPVVLDVPESMGNVSLTDIPIVREYVSANYCKRGREPIRHGNHATVWIRKDLPGCRPRMP